MSDNVTSLRSHPAVNDIPGQLRDMADRFERGEMTATSVLFVVPQDHDWPDVFGWGEHLGDYGNIAVLDLAKTTFINYLTERKA